MDVVYGHRQSVIMTEHFCLLSNADEGIYMSTTKDPFGTWSEPVNIRPGAGWIDPCPFWDEDADRDHYSCAGVAKSRIGYKSVLHMIEMQPDGIGSDRRSKSCL